MKTFDQLTEAQQTDAIEDCTISLLKAITEGAILFNDDELQARVDAAIQKSEDMRTPWFAYEYVMEAIDAELSGMALSQATESLYSEAGEWVIEGVA